MATSINQVNNDIYHHLGERWYHAKDDPVALLRAEGRARNPWVAEEIRRAFPHAKVLDIGCGAGFLTNELAQCGFDVTGLDASEQSLAVASRYDQTGRVHYQHGDAYHLPYADGSFAVVCAMDFLEHVEDPARVVAEAARVLQPGGLFFFHTFNRNLISWLICIKGVEWFVKNTPRDLHVHRLFIKPAELQAMCERAGMNVVKMRGSGPVIARRAFWKLLATGHVDDDFQFKFSNSTLLAYIGVARKAG
ncbi:MAG TPA: bifunctional 2-polyprenyl-6-hydroxyphenol methylase/3-demethylubiquinol 3-O-methyltransferase UbiG [Blastocatellia bacterium]|nr:bifunctional 2-polyprenyl-6-hydroxyphenol methylase/3-demethylubiquinol 3-O-methyltransferase UbiG [Blastocatellia bacterium]